VRRPLPSPIRSFNAPLPSKSHHIGSRGILTDGFDSTIKRPAGAVPWGAPGHCLRHAINKLPENRRRSRLRSARPCAPSSHTLLYRGATAEGLRVLRWARDYAAFADHVATMAGAPDGAAYGTGSRRRKQGVCGA